MGVGQAQAPPKFATVRFIKVINVDRITNGAKFIACWAVLVTTVYRHEHKHF